MKSTFLIAALLGAAMASYGQSSMSDNEFKPQAKALSTELNFNPFNGQLNLNNSLNQIKFRYFVKPQLALRLGFNVNKKDTVVNYNNPYGSNSYFFKDDRKSTTFGLNFGIEKHFNGTKRLSPYIGADVSFSNRSANQTIDNNGSTTTVKGAWYNTTVINNNTVINQVQQNGYKRYGVNLVSGFDFYMASHFFFGYEFNLGFYKVDWKKIDVTQTGQANNTGNTTNENSSLNFGSTLMNGIRIGYNF
ncbi:hypothetical protein [Mucilaginibacter aquatilis]|uniref:Outer membrane protein beta-barrel domain-containing protein n=1 Tax=Mucilaginibacter aquatilis TaxID=1517760 RepID=A0A6I4I8S2_9SPHI|nr:hypothetical protein [Mucilaginibacter aquatilis]MVN91620.1 hypothetical protein [Mucilaginibacter aquatilis]